MCAYQVLLQAKYSQQDEVRFAGLASEATCKALPARETIVHAEQVPSLIIFSRRQQQPV